MDYANSSKELARGVFFAGMSGKRSSWRNHGNASRDEKGETSKPVGMLLRWETIAEDWARGRGGRRVRALAGIWEPPTPQNSIFSLICQAVRERAGEREPRYGDPISRSFASANRFFPFAFYNVALARRGPGKNSTPFKKNLLLAAFFTSSCLLVRRSSPRFFISRLRKQSVARAR